MKFLTTEIIYRLLQRESPEDVYPDGDPSAYYSTADQYAVASGISVAYGNLQRIYDNSFPLTADELIPQWEETLFGTRLAVVPLAQAQNRLAQKLREGRGINQSRIESVVSGVLGPDALFDVVEWNCSEYGWVLDESQLDISTILNLTNGLLIDLPFDPDLNCNYKETEPPGYTEEEWEYARKQAYTYSVLVYDQTLSAAASAALDQALTVAEPARSTHVIEDGLDSDDMIGGLT